MQWPRRLYQGDMSEGLRAFNCLHLPSDAMGLGMAQALTVRRDPSLPACARLRARGSVGCSPCRRRLPGIRAPSVGSCSLLRPARADLTTRRSTREAVQRRAAHYAGGCAKDHASDLRWVSRPHRTLRFLLPAGGAWHLRRGSRDGCLCGSALTGRDREPTLAPPGAHVPRPTAPHGRRPAVATPARSRRLLLVLTDRRSPLAFAVVEKEASYAAEALDPLCEAVGLLCDEFGAMGESMHRSLVPMLAGGMADSCAPPRRLPCPTWCRRWRTRTRSSTAARSSAACTRSSPPPPRPRTSCSPRAPRSPSCATR